ncbi:succinate dehydrogenase [Desulfovibrio litoralis]|uniref:Succinate dehydrogenase subunit C n=1 Tax=Desulfovibrio litoralis DSM 11393 TaxID=1121455 RepID=A0A1M7SPI3_9BACT|nr:succinate dehydrogenase [Desulfovibrio litoralis]SHN60338.1 succinate dehydrogenase subunit C [Desulfovibrio litoralis DSM 11393]
MKTPELEYKKAMQWGESDPYRRGRTHVGMWAWLLQRISAVFIIIFLTLHMFYTYKPFIQFMLLLTLVFHAALGLRVIILDCNLVNIKYHTYLIPWLLGIGLAIMGVVWFVIY